MSLIDLSEFPENDFSMSGTYTKDKKKAFADDRVSFFITNDSIS